MADDYRRIISLATHVSLRDRARFLDERDLVSDESPGSGLEAFASLSSYCGVLTHGPSDYHQLLEGNGVEATNLRRSHHVSKSLAVPAELTLVSPSLHTRSTDVGRTWTIC